MLILSKSKLLSRPTEIAPRLDPIQYNLVKSRASITTVTTHQSHLLLALAIVTAILALLDDYQGWRFLCLALGSVWWVSRQWANSLAQRVRLRREMRFGWAQVGDALEERFNLSNAGIFPAVWVELIDHSNLPGYQTGMATGIEAGASFQWRTRGQCMRRGLFTLGPTTLHTSDPLGLHHIQIHDPKTVTLMVTPPIVPLPQIEVAPGGRAGEGRPRPNAPERTVSAAGVRQYVPGDSLHSIHWRTSARHNELFVRLFDSTPSGDWWIILDLDKNVQIGEGARSTIEHGIILAASLADRGLRLGRSVGLIAHGQPLAWLPPREGDCQRWQILRSLALVEPASHPLSEVLINLRSTLGRYSSLVIITPNTSDPSWLEGLLPLLWLGAVPTVLLLDSLTFGAPNQTAIPNPKPQKAFFATLDQWGIHHQTITPDLLDKPEAHPGHKGEWQWRISPTGRAMAVNPETQNASANDTSWRVL